MKNEILTWLFIGKWGGGGECRTVTRYTLRFQLAWVPFIEDLSEALTSGLVAGSRDSSEERASGMSL